MKRVPLLVFLFAMCLALSPPASATSFTLTDLNSSAVIDPASDLGMSSWVVDGIDVLYQQWFWFRVGNVGDEQPVSNLPYTASQLSDRILDLSFAGSGFTIDVLYTLTGGTAGSRTADIAETIRIINTSGSPLDFHFFQYSDFELGNDTVVINSGRSEVNQNPVGGGSILNETVETPGATHAEAGVYPDTLAKFVDGLPTTLSDVLTSGPGDGTWAFQWDTTISAGKTFIISKDKRLAGVPEPATIGLVGGALLVIASRLRKRSSV